MFCAVLQFTTAENWGTDSKVGGPRPRCPTVVASNATGVSPPPPPFAIYPDRLSKAAVTLR